MYRVVCCAVAVFIFHSFGRTNSNKKKSRSASRIVPTSECIEIDTLLRASVCVCVQRIHPYSVWKRIECYFHSSRSSLSWIYNIYFAFDSLLPTESIGNPKLMLKCKRYGLFNSKHAPIECRTTKLSIPIYLHIARLLGQMKLTMRFRKKKIGNSCKPPFRCVVNRRDQSRVWFTMRACPV